MAIEQEIEMTEKRLRELIEEKRRNDIEEEKFQMEVCPKSKSGEHEWEHANNAESKFGKGSSIPTVLNIMPPLKQTRVCSKCNKKEVI